jgi:hypothetical protein
MITNNEYSDYGYFYDTELESYINWDPCYVNNGNTKISQNNSLSVEYTQKISTYISISMISLISVYTMYKGMYICFN